MLSLIITIKNEHATLPEWLRSIREQTIEPDEIVIVDGGSTDGSWQWLQSIESERIRIFQKPGTIAEGRNVAIEHAQGDIIVVTDAGCTYERDWLAKLSAPLIAGSEYATTAFKPWFKPTDSLLTYLIAAATTPAPQEFSTPWLASSRSTAFTKALWNKVGGYPEWLPYTEDVVFDLAVLRVVSTVVHIAEPLVAWRPRPNLSAYYRQLYNYTRGDALAQIFLPRQIIRFVTYTGLIGAIVGAVYISWWFMIGVLAFGSVYMLKFWKRWWEFSQHITIPLKVVGFGVLPFIIALGDIAKMEGWIVGYFQRRRRIVAAPTGRT